MLGFETDRLLKGQCTLSLYRNTSLTGGQRDYGSDVVCVSILNISLARRCVTILNISLARRRETEYTGN